jgi:hypothetical protein
MKNITSSILIFMMHVFTCAFAQTAKYSVCVIDADTNNPINDAYVFGGGCYGITRVGQYSTC